MNRQQAMIESQKAEIKSLQGNLEATQDSLNDWDEGNLDSIEGVYVDDSIGTSITSVCRVTEPAISHPPKAGGDAGLFQQQEHSVSQTTSADLYV